MVIAAAPSLHLDSFSCSTSYGVPNSWIKAPIDGRTSSDLSRLRYRHPLFGSTQFQWSSRGRDLCLLKVSVAADYSDSVPDSSSYTNHQGYHPLEDVKVRRTIRETQLTPAEIARTAVEAHNSALLVIPGTVHCEPHEQISWAEFQYVIDDYGDMFFEIPDDRNILEDWEASNPVNVLIGMDIPLYDNRRVASEYDVFDIGSNDDVPFENEYLEEMDSETSDVPIVWGMPKSSSWIHPIYFSKCLTKAIDVEHDKKMAFPSNGVSIMGCLRPAFPDEASYLRRFFLCEDSDGYISDWKDGEILNFGSKSDGHGTNSTLYRLEIMRIELFSVYRIQSTISLQDFQDAEPDILVHSTPAIMKNFEEKGIKCTSALKALCKKKGMHAEEANLIGVDSLGMDVRILSGVEARTHRFPFKVRATSEAAAEKQMYQLLFPRSRRKKLRSNSSSVREPRS